MEIIKYPARDQWKKIIARPAINNSHLFEFVKNIMEDIRLNGDKAVAAYSKKFDKAVLDHFAVTPDEMYEAERMVPETLKSAIRLASANIETFHRSQQLVSQKIETMPGVTCWQKAVGIEKVGLYVPGGTAPLFSTVLMLAVPARIAGCKEIILCTPPAQNGQIHPAILYAARQAGVGRIFKIGGIQAIAAMTYGTETVPNVYKIFGPGNQYVTAAKQLVALRDVAIDMPAGPSEVEVIADDSANPAFVAADMLSQAEHGTDSQAILVTACEAIVDQVVAEIKRQLDELPRKDLAEQSLQHSRIVVLKDHNELIAFTNAYAPEHLIIETKDYAALAEQVTNAGSIFLGHFTPESAGDYASGTNHTLPTNGYARMYSGVNLDSFVKKITFQEISQAGIQRIGPAIETMAQAESLQAHRNAVSLRMKCC
ncbi:MAG: histidinol dehydrogenase [Bacteroidales bacterium]|jgi:histidinol dehydrogenase|nr:histidinol dehydrogenase [Bacteroidales bacterium]